MSTQALRMKLAQKILVGHCCSYFYFWHCIDGAWFLTELGIYHESGFSAELSSIQIGHVRVKWSRLFGAEWWAWYDSDVRFVEIFYWYFRHYHWYIFFYLIQCSNFQHSAHNRWWRVGSTVALDSIAVKPVLYCAEFYENIVSWRRPLFKL